MIVLLIVIAVLWTVGGFLVFDNVTNVRNEVGYNNIHIFKSCILVFISGPGIWAMFIIAGIIHMFLEWLEEE
jgi:hypothetical protein